ncbi:MAG TPA: HlyD family type I secretion periplasmic adaptor subunit [Alphaproteobacteria bacterium]|jgi:HlyD family secretion protein
MMAAALATGMKGEVGRWLLIGGGLVAFLVLGIGGWAVMTALSGAVYATAMVVVDSNVKTVQHLTGGVVSELRVREGDRVNGGDVLVRLDETVPRANLAVIQKALTELAARQARNEAERDDRDAVTFPASLEANADDPEVATVLRDEARLFAIRQTAREGQKAQLRERILQYGEEIRGLAEQVRAKQSEIVLIEKELKGVRTLWESQMIPIMRLIALERDAAKIGGERGHLVATMAQAKGKISEIELQIIQIDQNLRAEVGKDLAEIRGKTSELIERQVAAEDQLKRIDIRSPQEGVVHQLAAHTVGGVIPPGTPIMLIVPEGDALAIEAKIASHEIDRIWVGQNAVLRFTAFNQRTTPEINGQVSRVSADISQDNKTGIPFYTVRIALTDAELARLNGVRLVPGMPVESFIQTEERTVASYLTKPLQDHLAKAWKEK